MKTVLPVADSSYTKPGSFLLLDALTGMSNLPSLTDTLASSSASPSSCALRNIALGNISSEPGYYAIHRVIDTSVGVVFGVLVNYIFARPNYLKHTVDEFVKMEKLSKDFIKRRIIDKEHFNIDEYRNEFKNLEKVYAKFLDEMDYTKHREENIEGLENAIGICEQIYFHMRSIELLDKKLYLNKKNYKQLKKFYKEEDLGWEVDDEKSPVFNFHLEKIIEKIDELNYINNYA